MSTTPSSLSAGLQALSNAGLLPSNLTPQQMQNAPPAELTQAVMGDVESTNLSSLFDGGVSPVDSVGLSQNAAATLLGEPTTSNSGVTDNSSLASMAAANVGALLNYMG